MADKMSKKDQVLEIEPPNELTFTGELKMYLYFHSSDISKFLSFRSHIGIGE